MTKEEIIRLITENSKPFVINPIIRISAEKQLEEYEQQIRAEVIDDLLKQVKKEEMWLFKVIGSNQNINIAFGGIYAKAEQLKGE